MPFSIRRSSISHGIIVCTSCSKIGSILQRRTDKRDFYIHKSNHGRILICFQRKNHHIMQKMRTLFKRYLQKIDKINHTYSIL